MPQILKLLLDLNPNLNANFFLVHHASNSGVRIDQNFKPMKAWIHGTKMQEYKPNNLWTSFHKYNEAEHPWVMMQEYKPNFLCTIDQFNEAELENYLGLPKGELQCYSCMTNSKCTLQNLTSQCQWKLDAHVSGLKSPWSKSSNQLLQNIDLQVVMEPSVFSNYILTLKILNLKFHNDSASSGDVFPILHHFLSRVSVTATPEVAELQEFTSVKLGLHSPNPAYNRLFGSTLRTCARVPLGKGVPTVEFSAAQTTSLTPKSVTDWHHEQTPGTQYCHNNLTGTFSWTLENLGGFPFDPKHPSYPKNSRRSSLPFNRDGSVTFTNQAHPDTITWTLAPDLEGTMVAWCISMQVFVTILNKAHLQVQERLSSFAFQCVCYISSALSS